MSLEIGDDAVPYIQLGKYKIRLEKEELDEKYKKKAEDELRERPDIVEKSLKELRALISEESDFSIPVESDEFLIKFLRPCKFYADSAFERMKNFYGFKRKHPDLCYGLSPSKERSMFSQGVISFQEVRDQNGCRILYLEPGMKWKPSECSLNQLFRSIQLALESAMVEPRTQVAGVITVLDIRGLSLSHVMQFSPSFAKMFVEWIQDCIPLRLKGVHVINQPYIFNMLYALFKPFMREKLKKRIHFHGTDRTNLLQLVIPEALRPEHGGTMDVPELSGDLLCDLLCKYENDFALADSFGYARKLS